MESEPLARACELAFAVARQGVEANPPIEPPVAMRSFLYVPQLPRRAVTVAQRVVDEDPEFRARVAAQATEGNVGRDGYLWLHRPSGWDSDPTFGRVDAAQLVTGQPVAHEPGGLPDLSMHTGESVLEPMPAAPAPSYSAPPTAPAPPAPPVGQVASTGSIPPPPPPPPTMAETTIATPAPVPDPAAGSRAAAPAPEPITAAAGTPSDAKASIEDELASLRGLVSRLAEERQTAVAPVVGLETEVAERRAESNALASQLTSANTDLQKARDERNRAVTDREGLLTQQAVLESEVRSLRSEVEQSRSAIQGVEAERSSTRTTLEQAQAELEAVQKRLESRTQVEADLRRQLDAAVAERDAGWRDASALRVERDQLGDRVRVAEQARVDLEAQLDEVSGQWQDLKVEIQVLADERRAVETALDDLAHTRETSAAERRTLFNDLASQLGQVEAERDHLASQIDIMRARITGTRSALDMATHSLNGELESAEAAATQSAAAVDGLDSSLGGAHERLANLGAAIDDTASPSGESPVAAANELASENTAIAPPSPPTSPSPGMASGDVGIGGFLPEGVAIGEPGRPDATLFGNPRDAGETHLFGDPTPAANEIGADHFLNDGGPAAADESPDIDPLRAETPASNDDSTVADAGALAATGAFADHVAIADEGVILDGSAIAGASTLADDTVIADDSAPIDEGALTDDTVEADDSVEAEHDAIVVHDTVGDDLGSVDAGLPDAIPAQAEPDDGSAVSPEAIADPSSPLEARTSADDDQALANVMASYGFGGEDDEEPAFDADLDARLAEGPGSDTSSDSTLDDNVESAFDASDTSSFIDADPAVYQAPVNDVEPAPVHPDDSEARRIASTPDIVMLIDGDAAATMGWRDSAVADRRRYLLEKLDQVTGEYGAAVDVVFDPAVGGEDQLPAPTKVRRRLIQMGVNTADKLSELVDSYPPHFPIAVVSDQEDLKADMRLRSIDTLEVVQLLDLIVNLPEVD